MRSHLSIATNERNVSCDVYASRLSLTETGKLGASSKLKLAALANRALFVSAPKLKALTDERCYNVDPFPQGRRGRRRGGSARPSTKVAVCACVVY